MSLPTVVVHLRWPTSFGRGRRITIGTVGHLTPTEARIRAEKVLGNVAHGRAPLSGFGSSNELSLGEFIELKYKPWVLANRPRTADTLGRLKRCYEKWYHKPLREITSELIEDWKGARLGGGLSPTTVLRDIATLTDS